MLSYSMCTVCVTVYPHNETIFTSCRGHPFCLIKKSPFSHPYHRLRTGGGSQRSRELAPGRARAANVSLSLRCITLRTSRKSAVWLWYIINHEWLCKSWMIRITENLIIYSLTYNYTMILNHWKSSSQAGIQRYLAIFETSLNITNYFTPMAPSPAISLFPLTLAPSVKWDKPRGLGYFSIGHCPLWAAPLGFVWTDLFFCRAKQALNMVESCNFERWSLPKHPRHLSFHPMAVKILMWQEWCPTESTSSFGSTTYTTSELESVGDLWRSGIPAFITWFFHFQVAHDIMTSPRTASMRAWCRFR